MASICTESLHAFLSYPSSIALVRDGVPTKTFRDADTLQFTAVGIGTLNNLRAEGMVPSRVQCSWLMSLRSRPITQCPIKQRCDESISLQIRLHSATYFPYVACFAQLLYRYTFNDVGTLSSANQTRQF